MNLFSLIRHTSLQAGKRVLIFIAIFTTFCCAHSALAADGDLDPNFGSGGKVITPISSGNRYDEIRAIAVQSDGKIVVAGTATSADSSRDQDFAVARYNTDGTLDTNFDTDGKQTTDFDTGRDRAFAMALQSDGKIVVAGLANTDNSTDFAIARYNTDGSLDTSFDSDGKLTLNVSGSRSIAYAVAVQGNGKIVAAGYAYGDTGFDFALARFNSDGSLDTSFGDNGTKLTDFNGVTDIAYAMTLQSDGKIVLAGTTSTSTVEDIALARFNSDGSLDTTFSGDGKLTTDVNSHQNYANAVTVQSDGKIVVAGFEGTSAYSDFVVVRYNTDGTLDTSFDTDGKLTTDLYGSYDYGFAVKMQSDGKILVAGRGSPNSTAIDFALVRYNSNGSLDTTFSGDGKLTTDLEGTDEAYALAIQSDGKIVAAGRATPIDTSGDFALARYIGGTPVANDDNVTVNEDSGFNTLDVLDNDTDLNNDTLSISIGNALYIASQQGGVVEVGDTDNDGLADTAYYAPPLHFFGADSFTYFVSDGNGGESSATVNITVNPVNNAPSFTKGQDITLDEDTYNSSYSGWATNLSAGPINESTQQLSFIVTNDNNALFAIQPQIDSSGNLSFSLAENKNGAATVTVKIKDDGGTANGGTDTSGPQTFTITVNSVNDAPVAQEQSVETNEDTAKSITLAATDVDGDTLEYSIDTQPQHGTLTGTGANLTYTPNANYNGSDSFVFKASDNKNGTDTGTVNITVKSVNDPPVANAGNDRSIVQIGLTTSVTLNGSGSSDIDSDPLTYTWRENGSVIASGITPTVNLRRGTHTIELTVSDGQYSNTDVVEITVTLPDSTFGSSVNGNGFFSNKSGSGQASFWAAYNKNGLGGGLNYSDKTVTITSTQINAVVVQGSSARIYGTCKVNGTGGYEFVLSANDYIPTFIGQGDSFTLEVSNGYFGGGTFTRGDVKVVAPLARN